MSLLTPSLAEVKPSSVPKEDNCCLICRNTYEEMRENTDAKIVKHSALIGEPKYVHTQCLKEWYESGAGDFKKCVVCQGHDLTEADFEVIGLSSQIGKTNRHIEIIENEIIPELKRDYQIEKQRLRRLLNQFEDVKRRALLYGLLTKDYYLERKIQEAKKYVDSIKSEIDSWRSAIERMNRYKTTSTKNLFKQTAFSATLAIAGILTIGFSINYLENNYPNLDEKQYENLDYKAAGLANLAGITAAGAGFFTGYEPCVELASRLWTWKNV